MPRAVQVGEVWEVLDSRTGLHVALRVVAIEDGRVSGVMLASGRPYGVDLSVLRHGHRAARRVRLADGSPAPVTARRHRTWRDDDERRTASELRKTAPPRGLKTVTPEMEEVHRLWRSGAKRSDLAQRFGIDTGKVGRWCEAVEANLEARRAIG